MSDRESWLAARRAGIGSSDIAAVLGISPWRSPLELYLDKRGELPPQEDKPQLRRGRMLEPMVLRFYADETGHEVTRQQEHIVDGFKMATLDGFDAVASAPVEAKTVNAFAAREFGEHGSDAVPLHYAAQVHWQIMLTGAGSGYLAALIGSDDFRIFELRRDRELEEMLVARASEFWARVQSGTPPEPICEADVRLLYPRDAGSQIEATPEIEAAVNRLESVKLQIKAAEAEEAGLAGQIKTFIGEHSILTSADGKPLVTWKTAKDSERIDWQAAFDKLQGYANAPQEAVQRAIAEAKKTIPGSRRFIIK